MHYFNKRFTPIRSSVGDACRIHPAKPSQLNVFASKFGSTEFMNGSNLNFLDLWIENVYPPKVNLFILIAQQELRVRSLGGIPQIHTL